MRTREDERGCTASGTGVEVDGESGIINGSDGGSVIGISSTVILYLT